MKSKVSNSFTPRFWAYTEPVGNNELTILEFGWHKPNPLHRFEECRNNYLLEFILDGRVMLYTGNKKTFLEKGMAFLIPPHTQHLYIEDEKTPSKRAWISFAGNTADHLVNILQSDGSFIFAYDECDTLLECIKDLFLSRDGSQKSRLNILSCFYKMFSLLFKKTPENTHISDSKWITDIIRYIELNIADRLDIDFLCKYFGYARTTLYENFKKYTGLSIKEFIVEKRISLAKYMLTNTDLSISNIAYACGYIDSASLNKLFIRHTQISLAQYRKLHKTPILSSN